jgi:hypothetical protein
MVEIEKLGVLETVTVAGESGSEDRSRICREGSVLRALSPKADLRFARRLLYSFFLAELALHRHECPSRFSRRLQYSLLLDEFALPRTELSAGESAMFLTTDAI